MVKLKFKVRVVTVTESNYMITASPMNTPTENAVLGEGIPTGNLDLCVGKGGTKELKFKPGEEIFIEITRA